MLLPFILLSLPYLCFSKIKKKLLEDEHLLCDSDDASVDGTVKRLFEIFEATDRDAKQCIVQFFDKYQPEYLRKKVMELVCKIKASTNNDEKFIHGKSINIIYQILLELETYVATKDQQFKVDFIYGKISKEIYEECLKIVVEQDITECPEAVDYLFSIRNPENRARCITICVNVKKLLENEGSRENGNKWIVIFEIDVNKYNSKNGSYIDAINDIWQELVRYTVNQLQKFDLDHPDEKASKLIAKFFQKCEKKPLKISTMELMCKVSEELKNKGSVFVHEILLQVVLHYEIYSKGKDDAESDLHQYIPEKLRNSCVEVARILDVRRCSSALDLLLCITDPETDYREIFVADFVLKLLKHEKTFINGVKWTFIFDLTYVKIFEFQNIIYKTYCFQKEDEVLPLILSSEKNWYLWVLQTSLHRVENDKFDSELEEKFVKCITVEKLRSLIEKADCSAAAPRYPEKEKMDCWGKRNNAGQKEYCYLKPELDRALLLRDNKDTFKDAIKILSNFKFAELDVDYATKIVCKSLIYSNKKSVPKDILKTEEDKIQILLILEKFWKSAALNEFEYEEERQLNEIYAVKELPYIVPKFAQKFNLENIARGFFSYKSLRILRLHEIYASWSHNITGFCFLHAFEENYDDENGPYFLAIFKEENAYYDSWKRYLEGLSRYKAVKLLIELDYEPIPIKVQIEQKSSEGYNVEKFPLFLQTKDEFECKRLKWHGKIFVDREIHPFCANEDSIIECTFQKEYYKFISVKSSNALNAFIDEYLSEAKIIGADCETGHDKNLSTVFQLKADNWMCVIDVQELCKELTNEHPLWKKLFEKFFDPNIIRIGFAFENDFSYLAYTFPWLKDLLQKDESKVLCLQKLSNEIHSVLNKLLSSKIKENCSLAMLSNAVLDYEMDKMEQGSDWTQRPLTPFQKIYAGLDALIVVLIYDKLQHLLQEILEDANAVAEIMEKGYICYSPK